MVNKPKFEAGQFKELQQIKKRLQIFTKWFFMNFYNSRENSKEGSKKFHAPESTQCTHVQHLWRSWGEFQQSSMVQTTLYNSLEID